MLQSLSYRPTLNCLIIYCLLAPFYIIIFVLLLVLASEMQKLFSKKYIKQYQYTSRIIYNLKLLVRLLTRSPGCNCKHTEIRIVNRLENSEIRDTTLKSYNEEIQLSNSKRTIHTFQIVFSRTRQRILFSLWMTEYKGM